MSPAPKIEISVIIPVYNAGEFVSQAVESALDQAETSEILLIEDGSLDNSLEVCDSLARKNSRVKLFRHKNGENKGPSASRNLGIEKANSAVIAFLDADDFYLPGRFSFSGELFNADPTIDGVYEALGEYIENEAARSRWVLANRSIGKLTTLTVRVSSDRLFEVLVAGGRGHFHLDCTTVKRSVFNRTGFFVDRLRFHQDIDMIWKMAALARLVPGRLDEPVAIRRIHEHNTISTPRTPSDIHKNWNMLMEDTWYWGSQNMNPKQLQVLLKRYITEEVSFLWEQPGNCLALANLLCQNLPETLNQKDFNRFAEGYVRKELGFKLLENESIRDGYRYIIAGILIAPKLMDLSVLAAFSELFLGKKIVNQLRSIRQGNS